MLYKIRQLDSQKLSYMVIEIKVSVMEANNKMSHCLEKYILSAFFINKI